MKRKQIITWVLLLAMLCVSCGSGGQNSSSVSSSEGGPEASGSQSEPKTSSSAQQPQDPEPSQEVEELSWTTEPVLSENEMPGNYKGLELPVTGATGYTSVELPLWENVEDSETARQMVEEWEQRQEEKRIQEEEKRLQEEALKLQEEQAAAAREAEGADLPDASAVPGAEDTAEPSSEQPAEPTEPAESESAPTEPSPSESGAGQEPPPDSAQPSGSEQPPAPVEPDTPDTPDVPEEPEEAPSLTDGSLALLKPGTAFTILQESGNWWKVQCVTDYIKNGQKGHGSITGWVDHRHCMINLPDVIPSMVYDDTNAYSSLFISCGLPIDGITGKALYQGSRAYNPRLEEEEFMMPVLYSMAYRLCAAQRAALEQGNTLVLYEGYRPYHVQTMVSKALKAMMQRNPDMEKEVAGAPWGLSWFIATGVSNHQQGYAVDVSLARVGSVRAGSAGKYPYIRVEEYELYEMPTPIHELSRAAATYTAPVNIMSTTAWKSAKLSESMNEPALGMQKYCTDAGLTPLASEWWHFNDLHAYSLAQSKLGTGGFVVDTCLSTAPAG